MGAEFKFGIRYNDNPPIFRQVESLGIFDYLEYGASVRFSDMHLDICYCATIAENVNSTPTSSDVIIGDHVDRESGVLWESLKLRLTNC